jgi:hypothetical protein
MLFFLLCAHAAVAKPPRSPAELIQRERQRKCAFQETRWLFVRGLHHSGTTLVRSLLGAHTDVGEVITTGAAGEGQHSQNVFPPVKARIVQCDDTYRCGNYKGDDNSRDRLCGSWLAFASNKDAPVLLEKTPDLMVPFLGRHWGEVASLVVVLRHPLMWHYALPIRWRGHAFHCRDAGRPFLRAQRCAALWLGLHAQVLSDLTIFHEANMKASFTGSWALIRYEGLPNNDMQWTGTVNLDAARFTEAVAVDAGRVWNASFEGASPFETGACDLIAAHALKYFGYDLVHPKRSAVNLVVYDVDHDEAARAAAALAGVVASPAFGDCLRAGGRPAGGAGRAAVGRAAARAAAHDPTAAPHALFGGGRLCAAPCGGSQGACAFCGAGACCRKGDAGAPVACGRGVLGCLGDACCVGPWGGGLPDANAAQALLAAKKQWDAGGNAEDFSRAKARILGGG